MSGILSKWLVLHEYPVTVDELDAGGTIRDEVVEQWVSAARLAYLDQCPVLRREQARTGAVLRDRLASMPRGALLGRPATVVVTATASEVRPSSFTISVRLRPIDGDRELPVNASCVIRLADGQTGEARELGTAVRDELIALEHSAQHYN
jgi:acyl-CoA thioesterase FadM